MFAKNTLFSYIKSSSRPTIQLYYTMTKHFSVIHNTFSDHKSLQTFRILGLQQVALGSLNKSELSKFWGDLLGLQKVKSFKSEKENVDEDVMTMGKGPLGTVEIDLMTPLDPEKSPKVHIPQLNHIGLWVDDLPKCVEYLEGMLQILKIIANGIRIVGGIRKGASGHNVTFIHPKSACGVLLELVQAPEDVIDAYDKVK